MSVTLPRTLILHSSESECIGFYVLQLFSDKEPENKPQQQHEYLPTTTRT